MEPVPIAASAAEHRVGDEIGRRNSLAPRRPRPALRDSSRRPRRPSTRRLARSTSRARAMRGSRRTRRAEPARPQGRNRSSGAAIRNECRESCGEAPVGDVGSDRRTRRRCAGDRTRRYDRRRACGFVLPPTTASARVWQTRNTRTSHERTHFGALRAQAKRTRCLLAHSSGRYIKVPGHLSKRSLNLAPSPLTVVATGGGFSAARRCFRCRDRIELAQSRDAIVAQSAPLNEVGTGSR